MQCRFKEGVVARLSLLIFNAVEENVPHNLSDQLPDQYYKTAFFAEVTVLHTVQSAQCRMCLLLLEVHDFSVTAVKKYNRSLFYCVTV